MKKLLLALALLATPAGVSAAEAPPPPAPPLSPAVVCHVEHAPANVVVCYDRDGKRSWAA